MKIVEYIPVDEHNPNYLQNLIAKNDISNQFINKINELKRSSPFLAVRLDFRRTRMSCKNNSNLIERLKVRTIEDLKPIERNPNDIFYHD